MARIRTIKPDFFRHEGLYEAERETGLPLRVAFAGLWTVADREGRFKWQPRQLKLDCLPYDEVDFSRVLDALFTRGFIVKYACGADVFGCIPSWHEHQVINNREAASVIPGPNESNMLTRGPRVGCASSTPLVQVTGEGKGKEGEREEEVGGVVERGREHQQGRPAAPLAAAQAPSSEPHQRPRSLISEDAFTVAGDVLVAMGLDREDPRSVGAPMTVQTWLSWGWAPDVIVSTVKRVMAGRRGPPGTLSYFEKAIMRAMAELQAPAPTIEITQKTIRIDAHDTQPATQRGGSIVDALNRRIAAIERADAVDPQVPEDALRLLPAGPV